MPQALQRTMQKTKPNSKIARNAKNKNAFEVNEKGGGKKEGLIGDHVT